MPERRVSQAGSVADKRTSQHSMPPPEEESRPATQDTQETERSVAEIMANISATTTKVVPKPTATAPLLRVYPPTLSFDVTEVDTLYGETIVIKNVDSKPHTIRIRAPKNKVNWSVEPPALCELLAPGMELTMQVFFCTDELMYFYDTLVIHSLTQKVVLPLEAQTPVAKIKMEGESDFGFVVNEMKYEHEFRLVNSGKKGAPFKFIYEKSSSFKLSWDRSNLENDGEEGGPGPDEGFVEGLSTLPIHCTFMPSELGGFATVIELELEKGKPTTRMDVTAQVVNHGFELLKGDEDGGPLRKLEFGPVYFGDKNKVVADIYNNGPKDVVFSTKLVPQRDAEMAASRGDDDDDGDGDQPLDYDDQDEETRYFKKKIDSCIKCFPLAGTIPKFSKTRVEFSFEPEQAPGPLKGFTSTKEPCSESTTEHIFLCTFSFEGYTKKLKLPLLGRGIMPGPKLLPDKLKFGAVDLQSRGDAMLLLENQSPDLPFRYHFDRGTFFTVDPPVGTVAAGQSVSLIATYTPRALGKQVDKLVCQMFTPTGMALPEANLGLTCTGRCVTPAPTTGQLPAKKLIGGPEALPEDFQKEKRFVEDTLVGNPMPKSTFKRPNYLATENNLNRFTELVPDANTLTYEEALAKAQHKKKWTNHLETARKSRTKKEQILDAKKRGIDMAKVATDPVTLGLEHHSGMQSPRLELPKPDDLLFTVPCSATLLRPKNRAAYELDDGTVDMHVFKQKPEDPVEIRACNASLSMHEITKVVCGPPVLDFGKVCAMAKMKKQFAVTNHLPQPIYVRIHPNQHSEITTDPESQVVPPGGTAGLGIMLCAPRVQPVFKKKITYSLNNGAHTYSFQVLAEVVPVNLNISRENLIFKFTADNWDPFVIEKLIVSNENNYPADFHFEIPGAAFQVDPPKGSIDAKSALEARVRWEPSKLPGANECLITLVVDGATSFKQIRCVGENPEGKCAFREKKVSLGEISVGVPTNRFLTLKNVGSSDSFYLLEVPKSDAFKMRATPECGRLTPGTGIEIEVSFEATQAGELNTNLLVHVRGGKTLKMNIRATAIVPRVTLQQDEFNFEQVYIGGGRTLELTISNESPIMAELDLNLREYGAFSVDLPKENWSTADYEDTPVVRMGSTGAPLRSPDVGAERKKEKDKNKDKEADGDLYRISVAPKKSLTCFLVFRPAVFASYAFELPLVLTGYSDTESPEVSLNRVVLADALRPKLIVSSTLIDFENKMVLRERVKKIPYTVAVTFTNSAPEQLAWVFGTPNKIEPPGTKNIFHLSPSEGVLEEGSTQVVKITFSPRDAVNYALHVPLFLRSNMDKDYVVMELSGRGAHPRLTFSTREVDLPSVPIGVTSATRFHIVNHGYDNLEIKYKLPADTSKIPLQLTFPEGRMIGIAKQRLPVDLSFSNEKPMTFTATVEFMDEDGNRFGLPVTGTTDNCLLTMAPFIMSNDLEFEIAEGQPIRMQVPAPEEQKFSLPPNSWNFEWSTSNLVRWLNVTDLRSPIQDVPSAMVASRGQRLIDIVEAVSGKPVPGRNIKLSSNRKEQAEQMMKLYDGLLLHLKSFGALLNDVKPEMLLDIEDFRRVLFTMEQRVQMSDVPTPEGDVMPHWSALEENWSQVSAGAWYRMLYQVIKVFVLGKITPKQFKSVPGLDTLEATTSDEKKGPDLSLVGSNIFSVSESILLKWMTLNFQKALPQYARRITNFGEDLADGLVLYALLACHWPTLDSYYQRLNKAPKKQIHFEENLVLVLEMFETLNLAWDPPTAEEFAACDQRENLLFIIYLYQTLPQLIPKTTIEFSGLLGQELGRSIELTNPSNKEISYSVSLQGSRMFQLSSPLVRLPPKSSQPFEVKALPRSSRPAYGSLIFNSRKESGAMAATLVFSLACTPLSKSPIRSFATQAHLFEPSTLAIDVENPFPGDVELTITLVQDKIVEEPPKKVEEDDPKSKKGGKKKRKSSVIDEQALVDLEPAAPVVTYPHAFGVDRKTLRLKAGDKGYLNAIFLPFELCKHRVHIVFACDDFGEFVYEIIGECTMPVTTHTFHLSAESSGPSTVLKEVWLPFSNATLESAKRIFLEKHPLAKNKEQGELIRNPKDPPKELVYTVESSSSLITSMPSVTLFSNISTLAHTKNSADPSKEGDGKDSLQASGKPESPDMAAGGGGGNEQSSYVVPPNTLMVSLACKGPGTYPGVLTLRSPADIRVIDVEFVVTPALTSAELEFTCPARMTITQDIPLMNSSDKPINITARLTCAPSPPACFVGAPAVQVPPFTSEVYPLTFCPRWLGEHTGELVLSVNGALEGNVYTLKGVAEEPLAENHIVVQCTARKSKKKFIEVVNVNGTESTDYTVYSDLAFVSGKDKMSFFNGAETSKMEIHLQPPTSGVTHGSLTFMTASGKYVWYTLEVHAAAPTVEEEITVEAEVRKAVIVQISLSNPSDIAMEFKVDMDGEGVFGLSLITVPPQGEAVYELVYSPLVAGEDEGHVTFVNEKAGEYWYKLFLNATEASPVVLPEMQCEIGSRCSTQMVVENPLDEEVMLQATSSSPRTFMVSPKEVLVKPFEQAEFMLEYIPSSLHEIETAQVVIEDRKAGSWVHNVTGHGLPPTTMEETQIAASIRMPQSTSILFQNPFPHSLTLNLRIDTEEAQGVFQFMMKKTKGLSVTAYSNLQIPISFTPERMAVHLGQVVLEVDNTDDPNSTPLAWRYPIQGVVEASSSGPKAPSFQFSTRARSPLTTQIEVHLTGLGDLTKGEPYTHDLIFPAAEKSMLKKALRIEALDEQLTSSEVPLRFKVIFEPLKVFSTKVDFVVAKASGGRWRFELQLEATEPDLDGVINLEAIIGRTTSQTIEFSNPLSGTRSTPFTAFMTAESPIEFTVSPEHGNMIGDTPTQVEVSFTPFEYGKSKASGRLIIQTEEMQWMYTIKGSTPKYEPPKGVSSIKQQQELPDEVKQFMAQAPGKRDQKNYVRTNLKSDLQQFKKSHLP